MNIILVIITIQNHNEIYIKYKSINLSTVGVFILMQNNISNAIISNKKIVTHRIHNLVE